MIQVILISIDIIRHTFYVLDSDDRARAIKFIESILQTLKND